MPDSLREMVSPRGLSQEKELDYAAKVFSQATVAIGMLDTKDGKYL